MVRNSTHEELLNLLGGAQTPDPNQFKDLCLKIDSHQVLAKVFLLEGVPYVFEKSPMKYVIFREQVADRFNVGSQDICIVGSAKLGYSPSSHKFGTPFNETSDVDVVIISEPLFYRGSSDLFDVLNQLGPPAYQIREFLYNQASNARREKPAVDLHDWRKVKEAIRNFVHENFNPGLLPDDHPLRKDIFNKIATTAGLFLALEPKVFVSKIRCRIFRNWKAAEDYYSNSLREMRNYFLNNTQAEIESELDETDAADEAESKVIGQAGG
jgi:hypothetical protein